MYSSAPSLVRLGWILGRSDSMLLDPAQSVTFLLSKTSEKRHSRCSTELCGPLLRDLAQLPVLLVVGCLRGLR